MKHKTQNIVCCIATVALLTMVQLPLAAQDQPTKSETPAATPPGDSGPAAGQPDAQAPARAGRRGGRGRGGPMTDEDRAAIAKLS
jgi:hypothetical protein